MSQMSAQRSRANSAAAGRLLVRVPTARQDWAEAIPPAPGAHRVTVSLSSAAAAIRHGASLEELGYAVVGVPASAGGQDEPCADFLVTVEAATAHPRWWRAMAARADKVYRLDLGPAQRLVAAVLAAHAVTPPPRRGPSPAEPLPSA